MNSGRSVTICILTYNRYELLDELLGSLNSLNYQPLEIIVIDNHSTDRTQTMVMEKYPGVRYIRTRKNLGVSARNLGLKSATGDIVITLDDDITGITDKDIENLIEMFTKNKRLGAINFKIRNYNTGEICNWVHHCAPEIFGDDSFKTYEITEGAVAFRKQALHEVGYYSNIFFISHEGLDLALRLLNAGWHVIYSPRVTVHHKHSSLGRKRWLNYYYDTRNLFWVAARNFPLSYGFFYLFKGLTGMLIYSIRDGFLIYWTRGVIDGLRGYKEVAKNRQVLSRQTMRVIRDIDSKRESIIVRLRDRILRGSARL